MKILPILCFLLILPACSDSENNDNNTNISGSGEVTFKITLNATWSSSTHPVSFPGNPHFSALVGATHNINTTYWQEGTVASAGMEQMAETGGTSNLLNDISTNINIGDSDIRILANGIGSSPGTTSFTLPVNSTHPNLTVVTMLAPSPDWFIGVSGYNLMPNGSWVDNATLVLYAYDAGTDSGVNYSSSDSDTNPPQPISRLDTSPFLVNGTVEPVAELLIERIQ